MANVSKGLTPGKEDSEKHLNVSTVSEDRLKSSLAVILELLNEMENSKKAKQERINYLEKKIKSAFSDYCQLPYYLHSILVHDGLAGGGHYYTFIYDNVDQIWRRYNDHQVTIESEDVVLKEALGGQKNSCKAAYMLVYVNEFVRSKMNCD